MHIFTHFIHLVFKLIISLEVRLHNDPKSLKFHLTSDSNAKQMKSHKRKEKRLQTLHTNNNVKINQNPNHNENKIIEGRLLDETIKDNK